MDREDAQADPVSPSCCHTDLSFGFTLCIVNLTCGGSLSPLSKCLGDLQDGERVDVMSGRLLALLERHLDLGE